jgi:PST family polysaccharide transporter
MSVVQRLREVSALLLLLYGVVLGNALFPTWLFQGMERMVAISLINLCMKVAVVGGVFLLVKQPGDVVLYAALRGGGALAAGLAGMVVAGRVFRLKLVRPAWAGVRETLREGWTLFLSKASVNLYTSGNAFILGMLANHAAVGYYSAAEKLVRGALGLLGPLSQAAYPRFSKLANESREAALLWGRRMLALMGGAGLVLSTVVLVGAPWIAQFLLGPQYGASVLVMRILAPLPLLIALSNVAGIQVMIPFRMDRAFTWILFAAGALNVTVALVLAPHAGALGMGVAVLASEAFVTASMLVYLQSRRCSLIAARYFVPWRRGARSSSVLG